MLFDEDDEYYDDEYYDDEEYDDEKGGGGSSALVVVLVALIVVLGAGAIGAAAWLFLADGEGTPTVESAAPPPSDAVVEATPDLLDTGIEDLPELDEPGALDAPGGLDAPEGLDEPDAIAVVDEEPEPPTPEPVRSAYREPASNSDRALTRSSDSSSRRSYDDSGSSGSSSSDRSTRSTERAPREDTSSRSTRDDSSSRSSARSSSQDSSSSGSSSRSSASGSSSSSGGSERSDASVVEEDEGPPPEEGAIIDDAPAGGANSKLSYDAESLGALKTRAVAGSLSDDQVAFLEAVPDSSPLFTDALAIAMRDAEAKRDFKRHCTLTNRIVKKPENRYHPEWNLELAKCRLRNGDFEGAIDAVDRTLTESMGMTAATKVRRLLLAYEIKAVCRTRLYDAHAKANSGMGDDAMLNNAIAAWTSYRNYAAGVGDARSTQKAEREVADLAGRKGN
jgi:hypothetical protein